MSASGPSGPIVYLSLELVRGKVEKNGNPDLVCEKIICSIFMPGYFVCFVLWSADFFYKINVFKKAFKNITTWFVCLFFKTLHAIQHFFQSFRYNFLPFWVEPVLSSG